MTLEQQDSIVHASKDSTKKFVATSLSSPITPQQALQAGNAKVAVDIRPLVEKVNQLLKENISDDKPSYTWLPSYKEGNYETFVRVANAFKASGWIVTVRTGSQYNETYTNITFKAR